MEFILFFTYVATAGYKIFSYVLICAAIVCNIPVFTSVCLKSFLEKSRNRYIISMSVANLMLLIDLSLIPILSSSPTVDAVTMSIVEMYEFIAEVHLVMILLDQYRVASQPTVTNAETDNTRMKRRLCTVWVSSLIMMVTVSLLQILLYTSGKAALVAVLFLLPYLLAVVVSAILTVNIISTVNQSENDLGEECLSRLRKIRQISRAIVTSVVAFFVLLLPSKVYVWFLFLNRGNEFQTLSFIAVMGYILAAGATPFFLLVLSSEYRETFCRCCIGGRNSSTSLPVSSKVEEVDLSLNGVEIIDNE